MNFASAVIAFTVQKFNFSKLYTLYVITFFNCTNSGHLDKWKALANKTVMLSLKVKKY